MDSLPPGPHSRVLTTIAMATDYVGAFRRWHRRYGDIFTLRDIAGNRFVVLADPDLIRGLLCNGDPEQFGPNSPASFDVLVGRQSLLMHSGPTRSHERARLQKPVCRRAIDTWAPAIAEATRRAFGAVAIDGRFIALEHARVAALDVVVRVVFGATGPDARELSEVVLQLTALVRPSFLFTRVAQRRLLGLSAYARYLPASQRLDTLLHAHIEAQRASPDPGSVLASLLRERDDEGRPLSDARIVDDLRTMLIGGHESTANALAWALYYLHRQPELRGQLREQLGAGAGAAASVDATGVGSELLRATIDETLRIRPVAGAIFRPLARPLQLGEWSLPAGVIVSPSIMLLHLHPRHWPDPERFDVSRFLGQRPSPHLYMPFGGGIYRCLGGPLARFELAVMLSVLLTEFEFELAEPEAIAWTQRGLPLGPATGVRMIRRQCKQPSRSPAHCGRSPRLQGSSADHGHAGRSVPYPGSHMPAPSGPQVSGTSTGLPLPPTQNQVSASAQAIEGMQPTNSAGWRQGASGPFSLTG